MSNIVHLADFQEPTARVRLARAMPITSGSDQSEDRTQAWDRAVLLYEFFSKLRDAAMYADIVHHRFGVLDAKPLTHIGEPGSAGWDALNDKLQAARAQVFNTPVPTYTALRRKETLAASKRALRCGLEQSEIEAAIEADNAWLKQNARRNGRKRRGAS
jgi:hypothetical protein